MSGRISRVGGFSANATAPRDIYAPRDPLRLVRPPIKSAEIRQTFFDIAQVFFAFLFVLVTGLAITTSLFFLLLVRT